MPQGSTHAIVLDLTRIAEPDDPHAFRFEPQGYTLRGPTGGLERFDIPWSAELLADLDALRRPGRDPAVVQRVGEVMQRALRPIGWAGLGEQIRAASEAGRPVVVTLRSNAAELYALPWELLTVGASGQHLGELAGVLLRHEWPATATRPEAPAPRPEGGRVLLAWSAAGGAVPAAEHQRALASAWSEGHVDFEPAADVLAHASPARLADALATAEAAGKPFTVLHLLAHGAVAGTTFGLALDGEDGPTSIVDAGRLRQLLAPHAATLRLVVLAACDGGNTGALGNHLGSVAQALHRAGIQSVVASRYPLSVAGSVVLAEALYHALLVDLHPLERAFTLTRARLARRAEQLDWASLQLYARAADGDDTRPVVFCPYRGLLAFEARHRRFFFGRDAERRETLGDLQALIDGDRPRFLVVVGASGTGKSSMVLGGVVPDVAQLKPRRKGPWQVLRMVPGAAPLATLRDILSRRTESPLLLVVDQFEELFTHTTDPAARAAFVRELWSLSRADTGLHVIVTLRVDFLGHCGELLVDDTGLSLDRVAYDEAHRVFVARMAPEQVRTAIERPAARVGLTFGAGLLDRILADVGAEPGALPLLQYALGRLWEKRRGHTLASEVYEEIGGLVGALEKDADDLIKNLDGEEGKHARRLLTHLVDTRDDETVDTRRRVDISGLQPADADRRATFDAILTRLVDARLVVRSGEGAAPTLEIAHEALIRRWGILRSWISEDRAMLVELEKLRGGAREWVENNTLLAGTRLDRASEFVRQHPDDIDEQVRRFVQASEDERRRVAEAWEAGETQRRRRRNTVRVLISVLVASALGITGVGLYAVEKAAQEQRNRDLLETAKGITEELLVEVLPKVADISGTAEVQRELHTRLQTMLKTLRADAAQDPEVLHLDIEQNLKRGELAMTHERLDQARLEFEQALAIAEEWAAADPTSARAQRELSASLFHLGDVEQAAGDLAAARTAFARALNIREALAAADPTNAEAQRELSASLNKLGGVEQDAGDLAAARTAFARALNIAEALASADPTSAEAQRDLSVSLSGLSGVELEIGNLAAARISSERSVKIAEAQAAAAPTSARAQRELSASLFHLGDVEQAAGDLAAARTAFARALNIREALAAADPTNAEAQRELSASLNKLGGVEQDAGDLAAARTAFARALNIAEALASADPTSAEAQRDLSVSLSGLSGVELEIGNLAAARISSERSVKIAEAQAAADPTSAQAQRDLTYALNNLGGVEQAAGDLAAVRTAFARALNIREALAAADPTSAEAQRDLFYSLNNLGDVEQAAGDLTAARTAFERSVEIAEAQAAADPTSARAQRDLFYSLNNLGDVEQAAGDLTAARTAFERSLNIAEAQAAADPTSAVAQRDLSISLDYLGGVEQAAGDLTAARTAFERSLNIREALAAADPTSAEAQRDLSISLNLLGRVEQDAGDLAAARTAFARDLNIAEARAAADPTSAQAQRDLSFSLNLLGALEMKAGNRAAARGYYKRALKVDEALAAAD